ncbi:HTH-type transcriptional regulator DmlR [Methylobacterium crusticola]|uniref:HTH-type transcriptional regulator DmlR n=1 Tax=Methylobacterium crusticola TaxID=1697972 RepID=A0ABQ4QZN2_9HYPH|nr:LysR substrate-binding domain-containing protein [Methylobacterium crusticola]GJD50877.1 HTH-type transcriptional regulator DmlR [Methylobacterium crusticola]
MDRLASMAAFVRAADLGSFTAAAGTLGISAQMVGKHVGFLEERLGAQLLRRTTRRQSLTDVGRAYYARARAVLSEAEAAEALVHDLSTTPRGRLRVNAPVTFGACRLAPLVTRYLAAYPEVEVELTLTDRYVDLVDEGYDAVIRLGPLKDTGLAARALGPHRLVACAAPAYLAAHGAPRVPEDLAAHACLSYVNWSGLPYAEWRFARDGRVHAVAVRSRFQVNDGRALLAAALDGHGVILQPEAVVAADLDAGRLVPVLPGYAAPSRPLYLLFPARRPQTPTLRAFIDCVVEAFGREAARDRALPGPPRPAPQAGGAPAPGAAGAPPRNSSA